MTLDATIMVTTEVLVVGFVPKVPVIPAGQLDAARVTVELKPLFLVRVTVEDPVAPACAVAEVAESVKLGAAVTVSAIVVVAFRAALVPFMVSE